MFCLQAYCGGGLTVVTAFVGCTARPWRASVWTQVYIFIHIEKLGYITFWEWNLWAFPSFTLLAPTYILHPQNHSITSDCCYCAISGKKRGHCNFYSRFIAQIYQCWWRMTHSSVRWGYISNRTFWYCQVYALNTTCKRKKNIILTHYYWMRMTHAMCACIYSDKHLWLTTCFQSICSIKAVKVLPSCCQQHMLCFECWWTGEFPYIVYIYMYNINTNFYVRSDISVCIFIYHESPKQSRSRFIVSIQPHI